MGIHTGSVLLALLRNRFDGIGDPDKLVISRPTIGSMVRHISYGFGWHAWSNDSDNEIHARECRRLPFLARKMMEDLTEGTRIFAVRAYDDRPGDAKRILSAMSEYGSPTLLYISEGLPLSVRQDGPGLLHGTMPAFGNPADVMRTTPSVDWMGVFRMARNIVNAPSYSGRSAYGSQLRPEDFDEEWYLKRYPDVAKAVHNNPIYTGRNHYLDYGRSEGRLPVPPSGREAVTP